MHRLASGLALLCALARSSAASPTVIEGVLPTAPGACATCHADIAAQWSASAHHFSSFNNPYYRISVEEFRKERGNRASRFCAGCHEPVLVSRDAVDKPIAVASAAAQAGLVCLVCHSVDAVPDLGGNGGYHAKVSAVPVGKPAHGERLRPSLLSESKFCSTCHKVGLEPEVTHDRWLRGQDDWDAWQVSVLAGNGAGAVWRRDGARCQDCHMPLEPAIHDDAAAKNGMVRSHRFLGANSALPQLRGDGDHLARTRAFLEGAVSLDLGWAPDETNLVDVVMRNRRVGHRFPGGTMDSNEVWLEVEALDAAGTVIARSGGRDTRGELDGDTHRVRAEPVDGEGQPLLRRDPQHMRGVAFDASLSPADPQAIRFLVPLGTARVQARLLYRKFTPAYARRACAQLIDRAERARCIDLPVVELARAALVAGEPLADDWKKLTDRGLALGAAMADSAADALPILERARKLAPSQVEPLLGLQRVMLTLGRTDDVVALAEEASRLAPEHPAAPFVLGRALEHAYRYDAARAPVERLLTLLPRDPSALALAARIRGLNGDATGALDAADRLLALDPELDEGHYQRSLALRELGRTDEATRAEDAYLYHRRAVEIDLELRRKLRERHPDRPDESVPVHTHRLHPFERDPRAPSPASSSSRMVSPRAR